MRDLELIRETLPSLPEKYRRRILYYGIDPEIDWAATGLQCKGRIPFNQFYEVLRTSRFMISPARREGASFGGVSTADISRSAGRPLITSDTPPLRDALGSHNSIFHRPGNSADLREAIIQCFEDDGLVDEIHQECKFFCEANSTQHFAQYIAEMALGWQTPVV